MSKEYKGNRSTQRRVDDRSQRYSPAQDPLRELDDRIERECDRLGCSDPIGPCPECPNVGSSAPRASKAPTSSTGGTDAQRTRKEPPSGAG